MATASRSTSSARRFTAPYTSTQASQQDIRDAHRDLSKVWHPDRFNHEPRLRSKAEEKLKEINAAYDNPQLSFVMRSALCTGQTSSPSGQVASGAGADAGQIPTSTTAASDARSHRSHLPRPRAGGADHQLCAMAIIAGP